MIRSRLALLAVPFAALMVSTSLSSLAHADDKCPPGAWFCAETEVKIGAPGDPPPPPPAPTAAPAPAPAPPPVIIYTPAPPPPVYTAPAPQPDTQYYPPPPPPSERRSEVGLNLRLEGAAFHGNDTYKGDTSMAGVGASLRFRPVPRFALDIGLDALAGTDSNGFKRSETPITILGLLYLNPKSKVQVYLLGGFGFSSARVETGPYGGNVEHYSYFGGLFGGGMEIRVSKKIAINFDVRGFIRGRTDEAAASKPEFTAADGRTTNSSGGAMLTGGLTFYF